MPVERLIYLLIDIEPQKSMAGREYAIATTAMHLNRV
ncbi:potassium-transporting ATPase subunit KdpA [Nostoc sp. BAE]|nr:potassium-transporting ATPase subunit KdpA [Nostoc commune BAE]